MSSRFGRNKRRRAREAIAQAQTQAALLRLLVDAERSEHRRTQNDLWACQEEIRLAKSIAGPASILFPAKAKEYPDAIDPPPFIEVHALQRFSLKVNDHSMTRKFDSMRLHTLVARVSRDWLDRSVHMRLQFDGLDMAYAVTVDALSCVPEYDLPDLLMREAAPIMVQAIADGLVQRRKTA